MDDIDGVGFKTLTLDGSHLRKRYYSYVNSRLPSRDGPLHPQFISYRKRLDSFVDWPKRCPKQPRELAAAGFFQDGYSEGLFDCVKCFYCDQGICLWERCDNPFQEHKKHNPYCDFIRSLWDSVFE